MLREKIDLLLVVISGCSGPDRGEIRHPGSQRIDPADLLSLRRQALASAIIGGKAELFPHLNCALTTSR